MALEHVQASVAWLALIIFQNALSPYQRVGLVFYTQQLVL